MTAYERKKSGIKSVRHIYAVYGRGMCGQERDDIANLLVTAAGRSNCDDCLARFRATVAAKGSTFTTVKPELCV